MNEDDKLSRLYQQSRTDEPPMQLDSAVLSHAREAVEKKRVFRLSRWLAPVATVATLMLTASLIIMIKSERPEVFEPNQVMDKQAAPEAERKGKLSEEKEQEGALPLSVESKSMRDQAAPVRMAPSKVAPAEALPSKTPAAKRSMMLQARPTAPAASDAARPEGFSAGKVGAAVEDHAVEEADVGNAAGRNSADALKKEQVLSPEIWLAKIREQYEQGKETEAAASLKRFRLQYPDYKVPENFPVK